MQNTAESDRRHARFGSNIGQPMTRRDGILKVTGAANYAADNNPAGLAYAVYAESTIARGRVTALDVAAAKAHPGVIEVMTPQNRPALQRNPDDKPDVFSFRMELLQNERVRYAGQPIAVVIGETLEAATEGARLLSPRYEAETPRVTLDDGEGLEPEAVGFGTPSRIDVGEAGGDADASHVEAVYETPGQYHNAMEPHAIVAQWDGDRLTLDTPSQAIGMATSWFGSYFGIPAENVHVRSPFLGGGFGSKFTLVGPQILCILAARLVGRPVKLALRREQMFGPVGHRGATRQAFRLSTRADGALSLLEQRATAATSSFDDFIEPSGNATQIYASDAISIAHSGRRLDIGTPGAMRAPGEASGSAALECAMDEAAYAIRMDPLEFRLRNYAELDPLSGKPYSSKALRECYSQGASRFGWAGRPLEPRTMTDERGRLVGWGMGTAMYPAPMFGAQARSILKGDGKAIVETSAADMGQGAWTVLAQIAGDGLGLPIDKIEFRSGDSDLPDGGIAGGSSHTATAGSALFSAGRKVVEQLAAIATADPQSPLHGAGNIDLDARDGMLFVHGDESRCDSFADIMKRAGISELKGEGTGARDPADAEARTMLSHGAVFAEVLVDPDLCQMRVSRLVGAFAAGRIINPRLARSQLQGGMIWGLSFALHEEAIHDRHSGRIVNSDFAGYHVPVSTDVPSLEAFTVEEDDPYVNLLGAKGVGELGITGTAGAIANAIWHATGKRIRSFPIRIEDLI